MCHITFFVRVRVAQPGVNTLWWGVHQTMLWVCCWCFNTACLADRLVQRETSGKPPGNRKAEACGWQNLVDTRTCETRQRLHMSGFYSLERGRLENKGVGKATCHAVATWSWSSCRVWPETGWPGGVWPPMVKAWWRQTTQQAGKSSYQDNPSYGPWAYCWCGDFWKWWRTMRH